MTADEERIYQSLQADAVMHVDTLVEKTELSISEVLSLLLQMELKGLIVQNTGKYFQRKLI